MSIFNFNSPNRFPAPNRFFDSSFMRDFFDQTDFEKNRLQLPPTNIAQSDAEYILEVAIPGMKRKDIEVEIDSNQLTISALKKVESEDSAKNYTRREYSYNSYKRVFELPENAEEEVKATYTDGILQVAIPKKELEVSKPKRITVS